MTPRVYISRSKLIAHGEHAFELDDAIKALAGIHRVLRATLGRTCRVHASFNKEELPHLCTLEDMDEDFIRSLFAQYPAGGKQAMLNSSFTYQTRTRVAQGMFNFDHTINALHLSIDMPERGIPRKHVIALGESIIEHLDPKWVIYHNRALIDALYQIYPRFFRTAWLTYHTGMDEDLPRWRTLEVLGTKRGVMCVAKPGWFGRTGEDLLEELIELDEMIVDTSVYGW